MVVKMKNVLRKVKQKVNDSKKLYNLKRAMKFEIADAGMSDELSALLLCHSLEKGMGLENARKGFGQEKAASLTGVLNRMQSCDSYGYREGMSVLRAWILYSKSQGVDVSSIEEKYNSLMSCKGYEENKAGYEIYDPYKDVYNNINLQCVEDFIKGRHSVRTFKKDPVSSEIMNKVLELAACAPSACNRQPSRVYWTSQSDKVAELDKLVPGNKGFENAIPNWAIITSNRRLFGRTESLQWYVNGGIFVAYFVNALQAHGLGSCIFQIPITFETIPQIRKIANIPDNEAIVCMVGFGYPKESLKHIMADRRKNSEIGTQF